MRELMISRKQGVGTHQIRIENFVPTELPDGKEIYKAETSCLNTGKKGSYNIFEGSDVLNQLMDIVDPDGTKVDFKPKDFIGYEVEIEVVANGKYLNINNITALE